MLGWRLSTLASQPSSLRLSSLTASLTCSQIDIQPPASPFCLWNPHCHLCLLKPHLFTFQHVQYGAATAFSDLQIGMATSSLYSHMPLVLPIHFRLQFQTVLVHKHHTITPVFCTSQHVPAPLSALSACLEQVSFVRRNNLRSFGGTDFTCKAAATWNSFPICLSTSYFKCYPTVPLFSLIKPLNHIHKQSVLCIFQELYCNWLDKDGNI